MTPFLLFGLFGIAMHMPAFSSDEAEPETPEPETPTPQPETPDTSSGDLSVTVNGSQTSAVASDEDDSLTDADVAALPGFVTLDMGDGNDTAIFEERDSVSNLFGNDGDDTLSVGGLYLGFPVSLIDGGGGEGDDVISNFHTEDAGFAANHEMDGGGGDDTISFTGDTPFDLETL